MFAVCDRDMAYIPRICGRCLGNGITVIAKWVTVLNRGVLNRFSELVDDIRGNDEFI